MKFVNSSSSPASPQRLYMILGIQPIGNNMPFAELIALYCQQLLTLLSPRFFLSFVTLLASFSCIRRRRGLQFVLFISDLHLIIGVLSPKDNANKHHPFSQGSQPFLLSIHPEALLEPLPFLLRRILLHILSPSDRELVTRLHDNPLSLHWNLYY